MEDFISEYLKYREETEPPKFFHRWAILSAIGAFLARDVAFQLGDFTIHPNMYVMLIGVPGTRKSTSIKLAKELIKKAGFDKFSADKSSKEKFLLDLAGDSVDEDAKDLLAENLWGESSGNISEMYIACDEFNNFIGNGNIEFISLLGELWDYSGSYKYRIKTGKSIVADNPTINILGGNTSTGFALAFPSQSIGQGFFSRLILAYAEPSGRKITIPKRTPDEYTADMVSRLQAIKLCASTGAICHSHDAELLLDKIYKSDYKLDDVRFEHYYNRRFTHLLKLALICSLSRCSLRIEERDVVYANTILTHTEKLMPKALGEFGESRNAHINHKVIACLENSYKPMSLQEIWKHVSNDADKFSDIGNVMQGLLSAGKVLRHENGFLVKRALMEAEYTDTVDYSYLSAEEAGPSARSVAPTKLEIVN